MTLSRRHFNLALGSGVLVGLLGGPLAAQASGPQRGGTLNVLAPVESPVLTNIDRNGTEAFSTKLFDGLLEIGLDGQPRPSLAESWEVSADGLRYTFRIREGVKWHDGQDLTSADVAFSILTLKETHPRRRVTFAGVTAVETPDARTAVLVLAKPAPYLLGALTSNAAPVIPKHIYEGTDIPKNPNNIAPIGSGAYVFKEWERGSHVIVERNPNYWDSDKPYFDRIILHFIPDSGSRSAAFETEKVLLGTYTPLPYLEINRLRDLPNLAITVEGDGGNGNHNQLFFNLGSDKVSDIRVRRAIDHAIDKQAILDRVWLGYGVLAPSAIGPKQPAFSNPAIQPRAYDPALSRQLLDEAGVTPDANGVRLALKLVHNPFNPLTKGVAEFLRGALLEVGIRAEVVSTDMAAYIKTVYTDRDFDIDVQIAGNGYDPTDGVQRSYWSQNIKPGLAWSNNSHYSNARVDQILETAAVENDFAKRQALYFEMQEIIHEDLPIIGLVAFDAITLFNTKLQDHTVSLAGANSSLASAWLKG